MSAFTVSCYRPYVEAGERLGPRRRPRRPEPNAALCIGVKGETGAFKCLTPSTSRPDLSGAFLLERSATLLAVLPAFGRGDEFAHGVPRLSPPGESIKDESY